jgi:hypothetical protein
MALNVLTETKNLPGPHNRFDLAFCVFFRSAVGLRLKETGLVNACHPWAEFKIISAAGVSLAGWTHRMNTDLVLEFNEKLPPSEIKNTGINSKKQYLLTEFETGCLNIADFIKYGRYIFDICDYCMDKDIENSSNATCQPKRNLTGRVPQIKLLIIGGLGTNKVDLNIPGFVSQIYPDVFLVKDIDRKKTFSEIQALVASKTPLSFQDRFKLLVLPMSGGVKKINRDFVVQCFRLVYEAYGSKDLYRKNRKNAQDSNILKERKHGMDLVHLFLLMYNRELGSEEWTKLLKGDEMDYLSDVLVTKYQEETEKMVAATRAETRAEDMTMFALKSRDNGLKPSVICKILNISEEKLEDIFKNATKPSTKYQETKPKSRRKMN